MRDSGSRFFEQETVWSFKKHGSDSQRCRSYSQSFYLAICDRGLDALPHSSSLICKMMELEHVISRISCHSPRSELQDKTSVSKYPLRASSPAVREQCPSSECPSSSRPVLNVHQYHAVIMTNWQHRKQNLLVSRGACVCYFHPGSHGTLVKYEFHRAGAF